MQNYKTHEQVEKELILVHRELKCTSYMQHNLTALLKWKTTQLCPGELKIQTFRESEHIINLNNLDNKTRN